METRVTRKPKPKQIYSLEHAIWEGFLKLGVKHVETIIEHLRPMRGDLELARLKFNAISEIGYHVSVTVPDHQHEEIEVIAWEGEHGPWVANARAKTLSQALSDLHDQLCKFPDE